MINIDYTNPRWYDLEDLPNEVWKDIKGYEGLYQVSNYGRVKSLERPSRVTKIMQCGIKTGGYLYITLSKCSTPKCYRTHKLVAETFLPDKTTFKSEPDEDRSLINLDKLEVNHKDEDKTNNCVDNLEWCTHKYNANYGTRKQRTGEKQRLKINQYDLEGNFIKT